MKKSQPTAGSPSLRSLLQLQQHVTTFVVVVEVVNIINDQDRWAIVLVAVTQSHLLELVKRYANMSGSAFHGNVKSYPSRYPMQDRL